MFSLLPQVPIFGTWFGIGQNLRLGANYNGHFCAEPELDIRVQIRDSGNGAAMIRVTKTEEQSGTVVTVDGQLSGDSIAVVETFCNQAKSNGKPVRLFLRDVATVDQAGQLLLSRLAAKGVRLLARGVYTSYLVESLNRDPCIVRSN
jgi:hypothetical protein